MCLGCQEMKPKKELIRVVKNKENEISIDFTGKSRVEVHISAGAFHVLKKQERVKGLKGHSRYLSMKKYMKC